MRAAAQMLATYPQDLGGIDREELVACIEACLECAQACTAGADACLAEDMVADLRTCIPANLESCRRCEQACRALISSLG